MYKRTDARTDNTKRHMYMQDIRDLVRELKLIVEIKKPLINISDRENVEY